MLMEAYQYEFGFEIFIFGQMYLRQFQLKFYPRAKVTVEEFSIGSSLLKIASALNTPSYVIKSSLFYPFTFLSNTHLLIIYPNFD